MPNTVGILNTIRNNASQEYQNRIPEATRENIIAVGNALASYTALYNEFIDALINKIGKTIIEQKMYKNTLARFKQGNATPHDVEEIFIEMAKAEGAYDPQGTNPLGRRELPDTKVIYHRENRRDKYVVSIGDIDFRRVFTSEATLDTWMRGLINSVYNGDAYDEWLAMKNLISTYDGYQAYNVPSFASVASHNEWAKDFVKTLRKMVQDFQFASTEHNKAGVRTWSNPADLVLLVNKDVLVEVDVELLASAFNMGKTDASVVPTIIPMDDFGDLGCYALVVDKDFFRMWDTLFHMEPQRNADGLFTNYFLHHHQILSLSTFKNAGAVMPIEV